MESSLKIAFGIAAGALVIGLLGIPAMGFGMMGGSGNGGMTGGQFGGEAGPGMMGSYGTGMMGSSGQGMMGRGMMGSSGSGRTGWNGFASGNPFGGRMGSGMADMHNAMHGFGGAEFDMNAMHRAMHGEEPDVDMNQMHARMLAGNLTQEDIREISEHCPMMRNRNATNETAQ